MTTIDHTSSPLPKRYFGLRLVYGFLWFMVFQFGVHVVIGGVIGAAAGVAGQDVTIAVQRTTEFLHQYSRSILFAELVVFCTACHYRMLPGISKYAKKL